MKNAFILISLLLGFGVISGAEAVTSEKPVPQGAFGVPVETSYVPGQVLIQYKASVSPRGARATSMNRGRGLLKALSYRTRGKGPMHLATLPQGQSVQAAIAELMQDPDVEYAQPNFLYHANAVPNDPNYGQLWGLKNTGQTVSTPSYATNNPGIAGNDINAEAAWNILSDCSSVVTAVVDSGVNYNHEDLLGNMANGSYTCPVGTGARGCDFVDVGDNDPMDTYGHGTHVAGTIGAVGNNSTQITGVCQVATILAVRVLNSAGSGTTADIVEGVNFAVDSTVGGGNANIINLSLGGPSYDAAFDAAITAGQANGVIFIVAAGNSAADHKTTTAYPCNYTQDNLICVAAVDQSYSIANFSDFDSNAVVANRHVDIAAPGTNVLSAYYGTDTNINDPLTGWTAAGWSYAAPGCFGLAYSSINTPTDYCATGLPGNNLTNKVYKTFNLSGYSDVAVSFWANLYVFTGDSFWVNYKSTGGDPFVGGVNLLATYGYSNGYVSFGYPLGACLSATCSIGFQYLTDALNNVAGEGASVTLFTITGKTINTNSYVVFDGTSMATPHVAGIAALYMARNPNATYTDVINAILTTGDVVSSLAGKTKTGRVADAYAALQYIPPVGALTLSAP